MIILDRLAFCKWSCGWTGLTIIGMDRPLANDHRDGPASCNWSFGWTSLLQMILLFLLPYSSPPQKIQFPSFPLLLIFSPQKTNFPTLDLLLIFFPRFVLFWKKIFSFSKYNLPFPSPYYFSLAKKNSFSKYHPTFTSLFIFPSTDPKLKILKSWGRILIIYLI